MPDVDIEKLLKRLEALEADKEKLEKEVTELKDDYSELKNKVEIHSSFISALSEAQDWQKTMENVELVTEQITNCDNARFYCFDAKEQKFFTSGDNNYIEWHTQNDIAEVYAAKEQNTITIKETSAYIPIASNGETIGIVAAEKSSGFDGVKFEHFMPDGEIANTISLAINKEFNHQNAVTDELTKLKNRDGLNEYANKTLCGNINNNKSVHIVMCDIDKFKSVNNTYGHDAGDVILKNVAAILQNGTRSGSDCAFRMGGEEMVLILNCEPEKAYDICERLRTEVENTTHTVNIDGKETDIKVTVSMGLYQMQPTVEMTPENARAVFDAEFKKADELVYVAKETGRNKVVSTPEIYQAYLAAKTASVVVQSAEAQQQLKPEILKCIQQDDIGAVMEVLDDAYEQNPETENEVKKIKEGMTNVKKNTHSSDERFGTVSYNGIADKKYINNISPEQITSFKAALDSKGILYSGKKNEETGKYTITVDGWDNLKTARAVYNEVKFAAAKEVTEKSTSQIIGDTDYRSMNNKVFINGDMETISQIADKAKSEGVGFSGKLNGNKSVITVDASKAGTDKFIAQCKSSVHWANKINVKANEINQEKNITAARGAK